MRPRYLRKHILHVHEAKLYKCKLCSKAFPIQRFLKRHDFYCENKAKKLWVKAKINCLKIEFEEGEIQGDEDGDL